MELRLPLKVDMEQDWILKDLPGCCWVRRLRSRFRGAASTRTPELGQTEVGSYQGPASTAGGFRRRPVHIRNNQPDVSGTDPALIGRRDTDGEASTRFIYVRDTDPGVPNSDKQLLGLRAQPRFDQFKDSLPNMTGSGLRNEPRAGMETRIQIGHPRPC